MVTDKTPAEVSEYKVEEIMFLSFADSLFSTKREKENNDIWGYLKLSSGCECIIINSTLASGQSLQLPMICAVFFKKKTKTKEAPHTQRELGSSAHFALLLQVNKNESLRKRRRGLDKNENYLSVRASTLTVKAYADKVHGMLTPQQHPQSKQGTSARFSYLPLVDHPKNSPLPGFLEMSTNMRKAADILRPMKEQVTIDAVLRTDEAAMDDLNQRLEQHDFDTDTVKAVA